MTQLAAKNPVPANVTPLTVSQLTGQIKDSLEQDFNRVWVVGEISSLSRPRSGHLYFNLKDADATLHAAMWASTVQRLPFAPCDGMEVFARGRVSVYPPRGDYQLIVDELHPKGAGAQDLALRRLKEKLHRLGYFAPERKRQWARYPRRLALVASPIGAAIRDMLEILLRRWPCAEVLVCPVRVQGEGAADSIAGALATLNRLAGIDVVILGRGGGSSDDLAAFNEERVAHAIFTCKHPVIAAIGHEIDVTIADLVADFRAVTPSEAAERAAPDRQAFVKELRTHYERLRDLLHARLRTSKQRLADLEKRRVFRFPLEPIRSRERQLDDWEDRLQRAMRQKLYKAQCGVETLAAQLESLSPLNTLGRGYSLTRTVPAGDVIRSAGQVAVGDAVEILLKDGKLRARVEAKE
jgi:exodeoxyribonuclease VII large subunit